MDRWSRARRIDCPTHNLSESSPRGHPRPREHLITEGRLHGPNTTGDIGDILCVWAHPDDEAYLSAGLMMRAIESGHRVVCVTATKGEAGFPDDDPRTVEERMAVRERELAVCPTILGITEHHWMGYPDGGCADVPDEEAAAALAGIIAEVLRDPAPAFAPRAALAIPTTSPPAAGPPGRSSSPPCQELSFSIPPGHSGGSTSARPSSTCPW